MNQFGSKYRDPLEMLVEWASKIFMEINSFTDDAFEKTKTEGRNQFNNNENTSIHKEPLESVEEELERLKRSNNNRSKYSETSLKKKLENKVDLELRRIKNKYTTEFI